jgi:PAS domain S-box-containing protein
MPQSEWEKPSVLGLVEEPAWSRAVKRLIKKKIFMATLALLMAVLVTINLVFLRIMNSFIVNPIMIVSLLAGVFFFIAFLTLGREISDLRLTDAAIRESESRYRKLIEQALDGILVGDGQGRFLIANTRMCEMLGYTRDELQSLTRDDLFFPGDHAANKSNMDAIQAGEVVIMERQLRRKDGTTIMVETSSKMLSDGKMQAIVRDISERKKAEAALLESEEHFRSVAETANDAIITIDTHGNIVFWNHAAETIYGYSAGEIIGKQMASIISERFREAHQKGIDRIVSTGRPRIIGKTIEIIGLKKDGSEFPVELSLSTWTTRGGIFFNAALRDITERKKAEETLQESENRYRTIFEQAPDAILLFDSETGEMEEFNDKASENLGYTREEFQKLKIADFEVNESPEEVRKHIEKIVQEGSDTFETRQRRKNGEIRDIYVSARTVFVKGKHFIQAIWRDITEHKQTEAALRESEERFRSLVQTAAGIIICLSPDYRILEFNSEAERFFGCDRQEVLGKDYFELFLPETVRDLVAADIKKALEGEPSRGSEYTLKISDGRKRVMMWNLSRLLDAREEPVGVIAVGQDMTCRKRAEEKIGRLNNLYAVLSKINKAIVHIRDPQELYQKACRIAVEDGLFLAAWIGLVDPDTRLVNPVASWGVVDNYLDNITVSACSDVQEGQGIVGMAIREGRYQVCNDYEDDPRVLPWRAAALKWGFRSVAAFPLRTENQVTGAFVLHADRRYFFNDDEVRLLDTLAVDISFAINSIEQERARSKAEAMLKEHELYLNSILQSAHDAFIGIDAEGKIIFWNHGAERIYGYSSDEIINKPFTTILPERISLPHWDAFHRRISADNLITDEKPWEAVGLRKDGTEVPLEGSYSSFKSSGRVFFTAVIRSRNL